MPAEWFSPMLDGSNEEGKFKTRKGIVAMKRGNLQVQILNLFQGIQKNFNNSGKLHRLQCLGFIPIRSRYGRVHFVQVFVFDFGFQLFFFRIIFLMDFLGPTSLATCCLGMAVTGWWAMRLTRVNTKYSQQSYNFRLNVALHSRIKIIAINNDNMISWRLWTWSSTRSAPHLEDMCSFTRKSLFLRLLK